MSIKDAREKIARVLLEKQLEERDKLEGPYERALGKLAIRFSLLHFTLEMFSWEMWGIKGTLASILTRDLTTNHLLEKLREGAKHTMLSEVDRN